MNPTSPPTLAVDCRATLGEGLLWHVPSQAWFWTDIEGARLWRHDPVPQRTQSCDVDGRVGAFTLTGSGRFLLGFAKSLAWADVDWERGQATYTHIIAVEPELPTTRINDGRTDRSGHFVFGTMNEAPGHAALGHLYQFSTAAGLRRLPVGDVGIANSICFSPDGDTIYFCDSMQRRIMCGDYDAASASVRRIRTFVTLEPDQGLPDGSVVDAEGAVWNAQWGGAAVRRYGTDGALLSTSPLPVAHVTCPAFGGRDLGVLWATTARMDVPEDRLSAQPETGGLFRIAAWGARGLPDRSFDER